MANGGVCLFCGCSHFNPCPNGCGWADRGQTLCTECTEIRDAWNRTARRDPQFRRAFFRGYVAGAADERATETRNPYAAAPFKQSRENPRRRFWQLGFERGRARGKEAISA